MIFIFYFTQIKKMSNLTKHSTNEKQFKYPEKFSSWLKNKIPFLVDTVRDRFGDWDFYLYVFNIDIYDDNIYKFDIVSEEFLEEELVRKFHECNIFYDVSLNEIVHYPSNQSALERHFICRERYTKYISIEKAPWYYSEFVDRKFESIDSRFC